MTEKLKQRNAWHEYFSLLFLVEENEKGMRKKRGNEINYERVKGKEGRE